LLTPSPREYLYSIRIADTRGVAWGLCCRETGRGHPQQPARNNQPDENHAATKIAWSSPANASQCCCAAARWRSPSTHIGKKEKIKADIIPLAPKSEIIVCLAPCPAPRDLTSSPGQRRVSLTRAPEQIQSPPTPFAAACKRSVVRPWSGEKLVGVSHARLITTVLHAPESVPLAEWSESRCAQITKVVRPRPIKERQALP